MASLARHGELAGRVIGIGGSQIVGLMAGIALRRHRLKLAVGRVLVTGIAIDSGMRPGQRKAVVMALDLLHRDLPSANGVALLAIGAQLPPVDVGVAILAAL